MSHKPGSWLFIIGLGMAVVGCAPQSSGENAAVETAVDDNALLASAVANAPTVKVYKSPTCGCCSMWVDHMREAGFEVDVEDTNEMVAVKVDAGLPLQLQSCHTALIGDYVFEGHIPAATIAQFLADAPRAKGLAVPGMPVGSPGMEMGNRVDPYDVIAFDEAGNTAVYESH